MNYFDFFNKRRLPRDYASYAWTDGNCCAVAEISLDELGDKPDALTKLIHSLVTIKGKQFIQFFVIREPDSDTEPFTYKRKKINTEYFHKQIRHLPNVVFIGKAVNPSSLNMVYHYVVPTSKPWKEGVEFPQEA